MTTVSGPHSIGDDGKPVMLVGDIISLGPHRTVPPELVGKFFRIEAISDDGCVTLSKPYEDEALTKRYHAKRSAK